MKRNLITFFLCLLNIFVFAQRKVIVSGFVTDAKTGENLIGATIFDRRSSSGTAANDYGFFSIPIPIGRCNLQISYIGYKTALLNFDIEKDTTLNVSLTTNMMLKDIQVVGRKISSASSLSNLNREQINLQSLQSMPVVLGEQDLLKAIQYLPGIKSGRENTASFNVRGGSSDQNLILLDGVPVYNVNHLMGFFSVFNTDAIKHVDLYKGGIPARFGGRLSSVLDISTKEGNLKRNGGVFSISPVSARITIESPIKRDTAAYIISYRRSFIDLPMRLIQKINGQGDNYGYFFQDFNAKTNWKLNNKNRVYLSLYFGKDKNFSNLKDDYGKTKGEYSWGNLTSVIRWNRIITNKLFANFSAYYSKFSHLQYSEREGKQFNTKFTTSSTLQDLSANVDMDYFPLANYHLKFGLKYSKLEFAPNISQLKNSLSEGYLGNRHMDKANYLSVYLENILRFGRFDINLGTRWSLYQVAQTKYPSIQPRASVKYRLNNGFSLTATYTQMNQFLHLLTNSSLGMPTDLWVGATPKIRPQKAWQTSLGIASTAKKINFGIEGYYKRMQHVIRYDEGTMFINSSNYDWQDYVVAGVGRAYGMEFMTKKEEGSVTGLFSYTLSWSERKFEALNSNHWFPFKYDRRHDFSLLLEYHFKEKFMRQKSITVGFTLQSGNHLSIPDTEFKGIVPEGLEGGYKYEEWETRQTFNHPNNFKMPVFHHLDIGYNIKQKKSQNTSFSWTFSIYNLYNRLNPWYYYKDGDKIKQFTMFPIIPSVSFTYHW
ncbi:MAG TPA: TonB-dependent receptor [Draconibacterium sp.]|nr:TonB-dependent receptor [Draconibacterium sp.]